MDFDYFYNEQVEGFIFYRTPKVFFTEEIFRGLSFGAKLLYGILLDRTSLSLKNGWIDENGRVYVICTIKSIMSDMGISDKTATKLFGELERINLIERRNRGQGKPAIIFVKNFMSSPELRFKNRNIYESKGEETSIQESEEIRPNKNKNNNTNSNDTDIILSLKSGRDYYDAYLENQICIDALKNDYPVHSEIIDEVYEILLDTVSTPCEYVMISGVKHSFEKVKSRLLMTTYHHFAYIIDVLSTNQTPVKNMKQYLLTLLYNAPVTIHSYYQAQVNSRMNNGGI